MVASAVPAILDALIDQLGGPLEAAMGAPVRIFDGFEATPEDPGDFVMVGIEDPDTDDFGWSGESTADWAHADGTERDEAGTVTCSALSWNGDGDQRLARTRVFQLLDAIAGHVGTNYTLGIPYVLWLTFGGDLQFSQQQSDGGASALVVFKLAFRARI